MTPGVSYTGYANFQKDQQFINLSDKLLQTVSTNGLFYSNTYSFSNSFNTMLYGTFKVHQWGIEAIRHVITPNVTFLYTPDFGSNTRYGYYRSYTDTVGKKVEYNTFGRSNVGSVSQGHFGGINFGVNNFLEMKVRSAKDTVTGFKKIKIFDQFNITNSYNFLKDTMKLGIFSINANTMILNKINLSGSAKVDPYRVDQNGADYNKFELSTDNGHK